MRELIWAVIAALFLYVAYQLYRVYRLDKEQQPVDENEDVFAEFDEDLGAGEAEKDRVNAENFQLQLEVQQLRRDVAQLRLDQDEQRRQAQALDQRIEAMKTQLEQAMAVPGVAPEYSEALVFARRGLGVDAIAERCGITVSEAELVRALARPGDDDTGRGQ